MNTATATRATRAAQELARLLPSPVPLVVREARADERPEEDALAVMANFIGQTSAELAVVVQQAIVDAMAGAGALPLAEALRPALEAAARSLGPGVLGTPEARPAVSVKDGPDLAVHVLEAGGITQGWFGIRETGSLPDAGAAGPAPLASGAMRVLYDVDMTLTAEIGRTRLPVREVLELIPGSILELDRPAGSPADVMVNGRLVARGEVVVVDDEYAVRIIEIVPAMEPLG